MNTTAITLGEPPESMPIWARLKLATLGIRFRRVTHYIRSTDGNTIAAAADGQPVHLIKGASR
ncbi:hypothetical protein Srufu_080120 (plasmid) [Streptomyces libani subsp. rufus]|nr:hypothetical protein Srufu_080120 [Streptomyces libani subsp. rufus]